MNKTCPHCERSTVASATHELSRRIAGVTFRATVPAELCTSCETPVIADADLQRFELLAARELVAMGVYTGDAARFMRKSLEITAAQLAELVDVAPETVSRWETGKTEAPPRALFLLLGFFVADRLEGRDRASTLAQHTRPRQATVELKLAG